MPEVHTSMRHVGTRIRGLSAAVQPDEPLRNAESTSVGEPPHARNTVIVTEGMNPMAVGKASILSKLAATSPARIRVYSTSAARSADAGRATGTFPPAGSGCVLEFITTAELLSSPLSPAVAANNLDEPAGINLYCNIEPIGGTECDVTFTYLTLEA